MSKLALLLVLCAPFAASAAGKSIADTKGRVVLKSVANSVTVGGADGSIAWVGTVLAKGRLQPQIGYLSNQSDSIKNQPKNLWTVVQATKSASQAGVPKGHTQYDFVMDKNTTSAGGTDGYSWQRLRIQLIPFAATKAGDTLYDHNFPNVATADNPNANYVLTNALNGLKFQAP